MILGCIPPLGGGLRSLAKTGQHERLLNYYFPAYLMRFEKVFYFSYYDEDIKDYHHAQNVNKHLVVIPKPAKINFLIYAFLLPIINRDQIKKCDVLRIYQATGVIPAIIARFLYGIPFLITFGYKYSEFAHHEGVKKWKILVYRWLEHLSIHYANGVIVTTQELLDHVNKSTNFEKIYVLPNGVDTGKFSVSKEDKIYFNRKPIILFVGRFEVQKDLPTLLRSIAILQERDQIYACLKLVGDGSLKGALNQYGINLGIDFEVVGVIPHSHLPDLLNDADVFVLPSLIEGHPKTLIEAMGCGLPCVVSDCDGNRTLVTDQKSGLLFPIGDAIELASQLKKILTQPELSRVLGQNARQFVKENFDIKDLLERETEILLSYAKRKNSKSTIHR